MKRESIIRLMWISLGIHVGYFLLEAIVAMGQRQIMALSMAPDFEGTVFPVPYLLAGSAVYLVIHGILTVILAGQLERGGNSIASEVLVVILFGGALGWFSIIGNGLVSRLVGAYLGSIGLASFSIINRALSFFSPIRTVAISLLILASGLSMYCKLEDRKLHMSEE